MNLTPETYTFLCVIHVSYLVSGILIEQYSVTVSYCIGYAFVLYFNYTYFQVAILGL